MSERCPCGGEAYARCCEPFHRGARPAAAETLMRARYSAFVKGEHAFLWRTLHRDHEDRAGTERAFRERLAAHAKRARYKRLEILDRDGPDADGIARVLFHVTVVVAGKDASFVELSSFAADDEEPIKYVSGIPRPARLGIPEDIASFR